MSGQSCEVNTESLQMGIADNYAPLRVRENFMSAAAGYPFLQELDCRYPIPIAMLCPRHINLLGSNFASGDDVYCAPTPQPGSPLS